MLRSAQLRAKVRGSAPTNGGGSRYHMKAASTANEAAGERRKTLTRPYPIPTQPRGALAIMAQRKPNKKIPLDLARILAEKILKAATPEGDCLIRTTYRNGTGYTSAHGPMVDGRREVYLAHRVIVVARENEQIPAHMTVDHICERPACVKPDHLRVMPLADNILRSATNPAAINARKTHCIRGHEFTPGNTYTPPNGGRSCRACQRIRQAEFDARKRAVA